MQRSGSHVVVSRWAFLGVLGLLAVRAVAQQPIPLPPGLPIPRIETVFPLGARVGTTVEINVTGTNLDTPEGLLFSRPGFKAEPIKLVETPPDSSRPGIRRRGMAGQSGPTTTWAFRVTIPDDADPGILDLRVISRWGVSNPRAFVIGDLNESAEREPNNDVAESQRIDLNTTVNGLIGSPTDVDDFAFEGKKDQRVLAIGLSSSIDSRLLLALDLYDPSGKKIATNHEHRGTDALLDAVLPADGDYLLRAYAFTYAQGGREHFYRISLTTAPWIDAVFPPVIEPGKSAEVTVYGRNLPSGTPDPSAVVDGHRLETLKAQVQAPNDPQALLYQGYLPPGSAGLDGFAFRVKNGSGVSNEFLLTLARAPVVLDRGGNETPETAQEVALPCEIAGRIEARRDRDWYAFTAGKGDVLGIAAYGERLGSPLDLYFALRNGRSQQMLGEFDDYAEPQNQRQDPTRYQFFTRTDDPGHYRFIAPEDGRYELLVSSREAPLLAGPRDLYRVRIAPERPDFRLVVMPLSPTHPDALVVRRGGESEATVFVLREDGFNDEIALSAEDLPPGVTCPPQVIGTGERHGAIVFSVSADAAPWVGPVRVKGSARIGGRTVVREARSATITWPIPPQQQNIPAISRLDHSLALAVRGDVPFRLAAGLSELTLTHGEKATVPVTLTLAAGETKGPSEVGSRTDIPLALSSSIRVSTSKTGGTAAFDINPIVPPGVYPLVFHSVSQVSVVTDPKSTAKTNVAVTQPSTPVTLIVLPKEVAKVSVSPSNPSAKVGGTAEVTVRVSRLHGFAGEFQIELVLPSDTKGLVAERVTIPSERDEVKLIVAIEPDAEPGPRANLVARAIALYRDKSPMTQEARFSLNVVK